MRCLYVAQRFPTDLGSGEVTQLAQGCDFYNAPRLSPDGSKLCWVQWNHPVRVDAVWDVELVL